MSIEQLLERVAVATEQNTRMIERIYDHLCADKQDAQPVPAPTPAPTPAPAPAPTPAPAGIPAFHIPVPPVPAATQPACPITDAKQMLDYCMNKYRALGPVKGGMIQSILIDMGINNINAIPPERYAEFYGKVEALV